MNLFCYRETAFCFVKKSKKWNIELFEKMLFKNSGMKTGCLLFPVGISILIKKLLVQLRI